MRTLAARHERPLLVLFGILYAVLPVVRRHVWWAAGSLAVIAPLAAWASKLSGDAFRARIVRSGTTDAEFFRMLDQHRSFGTWTAYLTTALGIVVLVLVFVIAKRVPTEGGNAALSLVASIVTVALALVTAYYIFRTGDSGSHIVWRNS